MALEPDQIPSASAVGFASFHKLPYALRSINVQAADFFGSERLRFVKLKAEISNDDGEALPGSVFADSSSDEYVILAIQPRIVAGSLDFVELPAGMLDDSSTFTGAAAKEETGLDIEEKDLVDITELAFKERTQEQSSDKPHLQKGIYPSLGGCDEFIPIFMTRKRISVGGIEALKGKLTGLREHSEKITLKICRLNELWKVGARDGKTLVALALYTGLSREGKIRSACTLMYLGGLGGHPRGLSAYERLQLNSICEWPRSAVTTTIPPSSVRLS